ncbi:rhomboid-like protein [Anaeramoeba flamelloides]|uniref:rhomboid protease n=1 Tax=Anaeramoeba flamelloides TaxID=1746091 RepID=A0AAV8AF76_9EUKA|nr:rhomboid-like protein [Anaeramoeba flamelloides]
MSNSQETESASSPESSSSDKEETKKQIALRKNTLRSGWMDTIKNVKGTLSILGEEEQKDHDIKWKKSFFVTQQRKTQKKKEQTESESSSSTSSYELTGSGIDLEEEFKEGVGFEDDDFEQVNNQDLENNNLSDNEFIEDDFKKEQPKQTKERPKRIVQNVEETKKSDKTIKKEAKKRKKKRKKIYKMNEIRKRKAEMLEDEQDRKPHFIFIVSTIQVIMLIIEIILNNGMESIAVNPWFGPSQDVLIRLGAKYGPPMKNGEYWRFVTPIFLHVGIFHFIMNIVFQWKVGTELEKFTGTKRMAILYIFSGIGGNLMSVVFLPDLVSVGASSSLYGLVGVLIIDLFQNWKTIPNPKKELLKLSIMIFVSLGIGLLPAIDNFAHVGGMIFGMLIGIILLPNIEFGFARKFLVLISIILTLLLYFVGIYFFYKDVDADGWCPYCVYLNCLPFKDWCDDF